ALGVRLGGTLAYGGRVEHRPVLNGEAGRAVATEDIERAVRLSRRIGVLALGVSVAARLGVGAAARRITSTRGPGAPAPGARTSGRRPT
ncbi:cobalamin biosynthesis protein, partial [Streptomyces sp. SID11233]|nr:cobalamin biosynthesis protein [Streptomyces sp. SID11233]